MVGGLVGFAFLLCFGLWFVWVHGVFVLGFGFICKLCGFVAGFVGCVWGCLDFVIWGLDFVIWVFLCYVCLCFCVFVGVWLVWVV